MSIRNSCSLGYSSALEERQLQLWSQLSYPPCLLWLEIVPAPDPARSSDSFEGNGNAPSPSISSELTITPARFRSQSEQPAAASQDASDSHQLLRSSSSQIAGFVGVFAGCGALLALLLFLPLPARFQESGSSPDRALQYSYYIVATVALIVATVCYAGLRNLKGESVKGWTSRHGVSKSSVKLVWQHFRTALILGVSNSDISLGYIGGFVARASSVGISLFVPLLVNASFTSSGLCKNGDTPGSLPDLKRRCPEAYVLAAQLTGVSQMVALICAPVFGYASAKFGITIPLMFASAVGIVGYPVFATQFSPEGHKAISFLSVCLVGISQIGAIVCSLANLSSGVLDPDARKNSPEARYSQATSDTPRSETEVNEPLSDEQTALLSWNTNRERTRPIRSERLNCWCVLIVWWRRHFTIDEAWWLPIRQGLIWSPILHHGSLQCYPHGSMHSGQPPPCLMVKSKVKAQPSINAAGDR